MQLNVKNVCAVVFVGAVIAQIVIPKPKPQVIIPESITKAFPPEVTKAVFKQMLNEIEFGVYDDVPFSQNNFEALLLMKCELYQAE